MKYLRLHQLYYLHKLQDAYRLVEFSFPAGLGSIPDASQQPPASGPEICGAGEAQAFLIAQVDQFQDVQVPAGLEPAPLPSPAHVGDHVDAVEIVQVVIVVVVIIVVVVVDDADDVDDRGDADHGEGQKLESREAGGRRRASVIGSAFEIFRN